MGQSKVKLRRFLTDHPTCCFCGGNTPAVSLDHVPARAFFIDRKYPPGMEFPACLSCQNRTAEAEDITRLMTTMQGSTYNPDMLAYFKKNEASIMRGFKQRKPKLTSSGETFQGNVVLNIDNRDQEMIIETHRKLALALYYRIQGAVLASDREMSFIFFTHDKVRSEAVENQIRRMDGVANEDFMNKLEFRNQFMYKFHRFGIGEADYDLLLATFIHGLVCFTIFFNSGAEIDNGVSGIVRKPFQPSTG